MLQKFSSAYEKLSDTSKREEELLMKTSENVSSISQSSDGLHFMLRRIKITNLFKTHILRIDFHFHSHSLIPF